ncbi:EamA family transporter [Fundidesulfovibrio putealis]|uniref:EamA family transporter n=1 Tax=Fundidesulfovibrio putealis TaxID=270496 RepID=UPI00041FAE91|nr:EamA family transporter [Fundidesulfovibrio putealis]
MLWVGLMLVAALSQAVKDLCLKRSVTGVEAPVVVWAYCLSTTLFLSVAALREGVPELTPGFWWALLTIGPMAVVTFMFYVKSLEAADLSLAAPMLTATPLFLLITSPLMLGEVPDPAGIVGIVCIVAGSYVLNLNGSRKGWLGPFKALVSDKGVRYMLIVAFLWSISANIDKIGLRNSSPMFWIACAFGFTTICQTPVVWKYSRRGFRQVLDKPFELAATGFLEAVTCACQMYALTVAIVPYVIGVKRMSAVFAVLLGWLVLREGKVRERLAGAALMVLGVFLIALLG